MQDEEYLEDVDFDEIRRYDILKKLGEFDPNVNVPRNHQQWMVAKPATPYNKRPNYQRHKPQLKASKHEEVGNVHSYNKKNANLRRQKYTYKKEFDPILAESYTLKTLKRVKRGPAPYPSPSSSPSVSSPSVKTTTTTTTTVAPIFQQVAQVGGAVGASMAAGMMMMQDLNFQQGGASGGSVAAGTVGGGGLPTNTAITTLSLSLALVPLGLIAAAVFPPFDPLKYVLIC